MCDRSFKDSSPFPQHTYIWFRGTITAAAAATDQFFCYDSNSCCCCYKYRPLYVDLTLRKNPRNLFPLLVHATGSLKSRAYQTNKCTKFDSRYFFLYFECVVGYTTSTTYEIPVADRGYTREAAACEYLCVCVPKSPKHRELLATSKGTSNRGTDVGNFFPSSSSSDLLLLLPSIFNIAPLQ